MMAPQVDAVILRYLDQLQKECREKQYAILQTRKPAIVADLQSETPEIQIAFLRAVLASAAALAPAPANFGTTVLGNMLSGLFGSKLSRQRLNWLEFRALGSVVSCLLRCKLPYQAEDLADMVGSYAQNLRLIHYWFPLASLIGAVESGTRTTGVEAAMRKLRNAVADLTLSSNSKENRKLLERIDHYLDPGKENQLVAGGPWTSFVFAELGAHPESDYRPWSHLLLHCVALQSSMPSKAWRKRAEELLAEVGITNLRVAALRWLNPDIVPVTAKPGTQIADKDADFLKGFVWLLSGVSDEELCGVVADFGIRCLRKIPNIGPVSARVGFACVNVLAEMQGLEAVAQLTRMRVKVKYAVALKLIEKALNAAAERSGLSRDDLEDLAVPTYGLDAEGKRSEKFGDCTVDLVLTPTSGAELIWKNGASKLVKSPPAEVKQDHQSELKEIKRTAVDLQKMMAAQRLRIEQFFVNERKMTYEHWQEHFLHHPVLHALAKRLIWRFEDNSNATLGAWLDGEIVSWNHEPILSLGPGTSVQLWHPLQSDAQTILSWRCWLEDHQIVQPFKQAHREVYILTPAEEQTDTYSNRFAAHVIRQHQFASLCRERGWQYRLMGSGFDGHNVPTLEIARRSMKAEFWVDMAETDAGGDPRQATDQLSGSGINLYLLTDQVRFYRDGAAVRLADIPQVLFSEIMRDVDLFVGVTSIGNDPTWADRGEAGFGQYWRSFAFGELSQSGETRRAILERLLPQLKIASKCSLEGKFLVVRGDLHIYKIHLGSANVLMEPGSHYLCIVPDRGVGVRQQGNLYLPFDGDQTLAIILSKAFLLAADKKITDPTILRQIGNLRH